MSASTVDPRVMAAVRDMAKAAGFRKVRSGFRLQVGETSGLALEWDEGLPHEGFKPSAWILRVCPAAFAEFDAREMSRAAVPFDQVRATVNVSVALFSPLSRGMRSRQNTPLPVGYLVDDDADIAKFNEHLRTWFGDLAVPRGLAWLEDPGLILDALDEPVYAPDRRMDTKLAFGPLSPAGVVLGVAAGRWDFARRAFEHLEKMQADPEDGEWATFQISVLRELYPQL